MAVKIKFFIPLIALALMFAMVATGQKRRQTPHAKPSPTPTPIPLSTLSIEAGLIYNNGDVKPVARTTFLLLDDDLLTILKPFGETPGTLGSKLDFLKTFSDSPKTKADYDQLKAAIQSHVIATATTDFSGRAKFESLTPGTRFVYGEFHVGSDRVAWNVRVELEAGKNTALTLDNNNQSY